MNTKPARNSQGGGNTQSPRDERVAGDDGKVGAGHSGGGEAHERKRQDVIHAFMVIASIR